jgi:hypothetical protein
LNEISLPDIRRFCDRHKIDAKSVAQFLRNHRAALALRHPALEEHVTRVVSWQHR